MAAHDLADTGQRLLHGLRQILLARCDVDPRGVEIAVPASHSAATFSKLMLASIKYTIQRESGTLALRLEFRLPGDFAFSFSRSSLAPAQCAEPHSHLPCLAS